MLKRNRKCGTKLSLTKLIFSRNEELVTKLTKCKEEYTQKCYEVHNLKKQLAAGKQSSEEVPGGSSDAIESVMQELESRRDKCKELEEKNARFEELNVSLEERVLIAEQMNVELNEEKISSAEKFESMVKEKDEQIGELTQQMLQLTEELSSIQDTNDNKMQHMNNAVQSLRRQMESKDKEIATLKGTRNPPQSIYTQHPSTCGTVLPPAQNHPPQVTPTTTASNAKVCPMCQVKFPASYTSSEFEAHVQSHFDY